MTVCVVETHRIGPSSLCAGGQRTAELVASTELISATEMRTYFPASEIWFERVLGIPKSLVAIKAET